MAVKAHPAIHWRSATCPVDDQRTGACINGRGPHGSNRYAPARQSLMSSGTHGFICIVYCVSFIEGWALGVTIVVVFLLIILLGVLPIWISVHLGNQKGHYLAGWLLGLFLGWIGVIIMAILSPSADSERQRLLQTGFPCPHCREPVQQGATVCPHCRRDVNPIPPPA